MAKSQFLVYCVWIVCLQTVALNLCVLGMIIENLFLATCFYYLLCTIEHKQNIDMGRAIYSIHKLYRHFVYIRITLLSLSVFQKRLETIFEEIQVLWATATLFNSILYMYVQCINLNTENKRINSMNQVLFFMINVVLLLWCKTVTSCYKR